jgi:hypothetical protein
MRAIPITTLCVVLTAILIALNATGALAVPIAGRSSAAGGGALQYSDNPVPYGISPTTGLPTVNMEYKPLIMVMSNQPEARPHWNMSEADIVYEAVYSGPSHTRYTLVYNDTMPDMAGGLRSARVFSASLRQEWDCPFVFWGWQTLTGTSVSDYFKQHNVDLKFQINGVTNKYEDVLFRTSGQFARRSPHNAAANLAAISAKYYPDYTPRNHAYKFSDTVQNGYDSAVAVNINYGEDYNPTYTYNEAQRLYERSYNGQPEMDGYTGKRIVASNVIVQRVKLMFFNNTSSRPVYELVGEGLADMFIGGRHIQGKWVRNSDDSRTVFIDFMGNEVPLLPGKTFIQLVANTLDYTYTRQDGAVITNTFDESKLTEAETAPINVDDSELDNLGEE